MTKLLNKKLQNNTKRGDENDIVNGTGDSIVEILLAPFKSAWRTYRYQQQPANISLVYIIKIMRLLGIWPREWQTEYLYYKIIYTTLQILMAIFALTITCDLYEASKDIILLGDDLVVLIGFYLISFKAVCYFHHAKDIEHIIGEFNKMHYYFGHLEKSPSLGKIQKLQRKYFALEIFSHGSFFTLALLFSAASIFPPLFIQSGGTPYRAKFPFEWSNYDEYPIRFSCIYIFQSILTVFILLSIIYIDFIGCHIFVQTTLNLKIFCIRIRDLGLQPGEDYIDEIHVMIKFHQYIIKLIEEINNTYYYTYIAQIGASTFMICLSAFEAVLAQDQPMVAIRFQMYMFSSFAQLLYWCGNGNMVYYASLDVADAAYEIQNWYDQSKDFKYCLKFFIKRSQDPLIFRPKPFFGFNFESFTNILSTSYSYFTLLRTMSD